MTMANCKSATTPKNSSDRAESEVTQRMMTIKAVITWVLMLMQPPTSANGKINCHQSSNHPSLLRHLPSLPLYSRMSWPVTKFVKLMSISRQSSKCKESRCLCAGTFWGELFPRISTGVNARDKSLTVTQWCMIRTRILGVQKKEPFGLNLMSQRQNGKILLRPAFQI